MSGDYPSDLLEEVPARRYRNGELEAGVIALAREVPYTLFVNDREILSIATLPLHLQELFTGFLVSEGVLTAPDQIDTCRVDHDNKLVFFELHVAEERIEKLERKGMLTSGCAGGLVFSLESSIAPPVVNGPLQLPCSAILKRMQDLDTFPGIYRRTKGVHGASVATPDETLMILEDLGRHNAVDKIVGYCFLNRIYTGDKLLLTTGRITSEVLSKASRGGFPIVVSRSSVSALAAQLARQCAIDVVSYARGGRFNYLSHGRVELV